MEINQYFKENFMKNVVIGLTLIGASVLLTVALTGQAIYSKGYHDGVRTTVKTIKEDFEKLLEEMKQHATEESQEEIES